MNTAVFWEAPSIKNSATREKVRGFGWRYGMLNGKSMSSLKDFSGMKGVNASDPGERCTFLRICREGGKSLISANGCPVLLR